MAALHSHCTEGDAPAGVSGDSHLSRFSGQRSPAVRGRSCAVTVWCCDCEVPSVLRGVGLPAGVGRRREWASVLGLGPARRAPVCGGCGVSRDGERTAGCRDLRLRSGEADCRSGGCARAQRVARFPCSCGGSVAAGRPGSAVVPAAAAECRQASRAVSRCSRGFPLLQRSRFLLPGCACPSSPFSGAGRPSSRPPLLGPSGSSSASQPAAFRGGRVARRRAGATCGAAADGGSEATAAWILSLQQPIASQCTAQCWGNAAARG